MVTHVAEDQSTLEPTERHRAGLILTLMLLACVTDESDGVVTLDQLTAERALTSEDVDLEKVLVERQEHIHECPGSWIRYRAV